MGQRGVTAQLSEQYKTVQTAEEGGGLRRRRLPPRLDRKCTPVARAPAAAVCPLRRPAWPACLPRGGGGGLDGPEMQASLPTAPAAGRAGEEGPPAASHGRRRRLARWNSDGECADRCSVRHSGRQREREGSGGGEGRRRRVREWQQAYAALSHAQGGSKPPSKQSVINPMKGNVALSWKKSSRCDTSDKLGNIS